MRLLPHGPADGMRLLPPVPLMPIHLQSGHGWSSSGARPPGRTAGPHAAAYRDAGSPSWSVGARSTASGRGCSTLTSPGMSSPGGYCPTWATSPPSGSPRLATTTATPMASHRSWGTSPSSSASTPPIAGCREESRRSSGGCRTPTCSSYRSTASPAAFRRSWAAGARPSSLRQWPGG
ncbi:hypothetical protein BS78_10G057200 [Paspalum vaginatum]|nr:hypothetical protein BS78_10G057200 [Paspalum vaginatum]